MKQARWGIIGLGNIALNFAEGLKNAKNAKLIAISSQNEKKCELFKNKYKIDDKYSFLNYEKLLNCEDVDIVYIALPNSFHHEWVIKSIVKENKDIKFIGVSVLTSFSNNDLENLGFANNVENQVQRLVKIASKANLYGVVCSPWEVKMVKKINSKLLCFTPGIRFQVSKDDQKRTMTPKEAINEGSDYLILGRPLTSGNPKENIKKIIESLK